jgi:hypothetical protein
MRRSEIDSTRDAGMPSRFFPIAWLVVLVLFSLPLDRPAAAGAVEGAAAGASGRAR